MAAGTEASEQAPLADLVTQEAGMSSEYTLTAWKPQIIEYTYKWNGKDVTTKKLQVILLSPNPAQYCLGVARIRKDQPQELQSLLEKYKKNTGWKFSKIKLLEEKACYIHTACRVTIDLRKSTSIAMLQSAHMPKAPDPACRIADILLLTQTQRFDLLAVPSEIMDERRNSLTNLPIADVRIKDTSGMDMDGSASSSLPITIFFTSNSDMDSFKQHVGKTALLFMCLQGHMGDGASQLQVKTIKDLFWWQVGVGPRAEEMTAQAQQICGMRTADVQTLTPFQGNTAADYITVPATLTVCRILDAMTSTTTRDLLGDATEHLYQLNLVYVQRPHRSDTIHVRDGSRLFAQLQCWDYSKSIQLAFRSKAMLQLAGIEPGDTAETTYAAQLQSGDLKHPILASLRVRVSKPKTSATEPGTALQSSDFPQSQSSDNQQSLLSAVVVEAEEFVLTEIPNDAVDAVHGLLACLPKTTDHIAALPLQKLQYSPFYNIVADKAPADKALILLCFSKKSVGKNLQGGYRIVTDDVQDATDVANEKKYGTVALCTFETAPDFQIVPPRGGSKSITALVIISKITQPAKGQHEADLYLEAMHIVPEDQKDQSVVMMHQMHRVSSASQSAYGREADASEDAQAAWDQRKCRRLHRYPTMT